MTLSSQDADALFEQLVDTFGRGDREGAIRLAVAAFEQGLDEPLVLVLVAEDLDGKGRGREALDVLYQAAEMAPDEAEVWYCLGTMLVRQGSEEDGLARLQQALALAPDLLPALVNAAGSSYRLGLLGEAERYYRRILELAPHSGEPLAALAAIAARWRRSEEARRLAQQALALLPDNVTAEMAIGRADVIDGLAERAAARMDRLLGRAGLDDDTRVAALDLRAEALDALDRAGEAFADYVSRNTLLQRQYAPRIARAAPERQVDYARRLAGYFAAQSPAHWRAAAAERADESTACRHAFLLGFPRSGTTLLEKALACHPEVITLEELDLLGGLSQQWLAVDGDIAALAQMPARQAEHLSQDYWQRVRDATGSDLAGKMLVDKLPLHTLVLPVIARLFPGAKILFALRDPRDVVLSCFRRRFQMNPAMFEFLELEGAARYYHEVMTLAGIYRGLLPLEVHEVRHEAMVAGLESTLRDVLDFLGLPWDAAVTRLVEHLPADPRTPSDMQLRRGINAEGVGQWRRYRAQMMPVLESLEPWVARFGYS